MAGSHEAGLSAYAPSHFPQPDVPYQRMRDEHSWDDAAAANKHPLQPASTTDKSGGEARSGRTSTERGSAADKALLDAGGAIVSRLRLRPIAARALEILMEREEKAHGKQRAAIERALIEAAGGADLLEQQLADEQAAAEAAEVAALAGHGRPRLSSIENDLVALLERGPIVGTAEVGYHLWPDREMQPQGAACAANGILRRLLDRGYIDSDQVGDRRRWCVTTAGSDAREQDRIDAIDPRQLTLLED